MRLLKEVKEWKGDAYWKYLVPGPQGKREGAVARVARRPRLCRVTVVGVLLLHRMYASKSQ